MCQFFGCANKARIHGNGRQGDYCDAHECNKRGCFNRIRTHANGKLSRFCKTHECASSGCVSCVRTHANGKHGHFCENHECAASGCSNKRMDVEYIKNPYDNSFLEVKTKFCERHRCEYLSGMSFGARCENKKVYGSTVCHIEH